MSNPLFIEVLTDNERTRTIDHNNRDDRVWLGKHCFWAFRNGKSVTTRPIQQKDAD